jgi:hypothetical protein
MPQPLLRRRDALLRLDHRRVAIGELRQRILELAIGGAELALRLRHHALGGDPLGRRRCGDPDRGTIGGRVEARLDALLLALERVEARVARGGLL